MSVAEKVRQLKPKVASAVPAEIITVTPQMAEEMLAKNVKNRSVSYGLVDAYARDMRNGDWQFTGEALKFSVDGHLIDGQHRLLACVKADVPFKTLVIYDLESRAQEVIDTGRGRTVADALHLAGYANASRTAGACRFMMNIKNGYNKCKISASEMLHVFERHPGINDSANMVGGTYGMSQALLTAIHYIGKGILDMEALANEFVTIFQTGNSYDGCAAQVWRERLMKMKAAHTPITHTYMFHGSIHAWNLFAKSQDIKIFRAPESAKIDGLDLDLI